MIAHWELFDLIIRSGADVKFILLLFKFTKRMRSVEHPTHSAVALRRRLRADAWARYCDGGVEARSRSAP